MQSPQREPGLDQQQKRDQDPEPVKEHQVDPQVEPAWRVQVGAADQPIRTEGHPAAIQLAHAQSDLQEVSVNAQYMQSVLSVWAAEAAPTTVCSMVVVLPVVLAL